jgi:hypothetical protein
MSGASFANTVSQWHEMVRACEAVIADQKFAPLAHYGSAPFSHGLPGVKEYSVYNGTQTLVAIARVEQDDWVRCLVRENVENRSRWREVAAEWKSGFVLGFPRGAYKWVNWPFNPNRPFLGAVRCLSDDSGILIAPNLDTDLLFRVEISKYAPQSCDSL